MPLVEWPDRLPGYVWMPDDGDFSRQKSPPKGIIWHSGQTHPGVAEYAEDEPDGRKISYHFAWESTEHHLFVQMVSLRWRAWHAGGTKIPGTPFRGNDLIGIALPGPWDSPRSDWEKTCCIVLVQNLQAAFGDTLEFWCRHSDFAKKKDPGPGFKDEWMEGLGLERIAA